MPRARPEAEEWLDLGDAEALAAFYREGDALALAIALKDKSGHSAFAHSLHRLALLLGAATAGAGAPSRVVARFGRGERERCP